MQKITKKDGAGFSAARPARPAWGEAIKNGAVLTLLLGFLFGFFLWGIFEPDAAISDSERRPLAQAPELSAKNLWDGGFMEQFEEYAMDQFPLRDSFRRVKAYTAFNLMRRKDVNGVYVSEGYASKLEYPENEEAIARAAEKFEYLYERYLKGEGTRVYLSVVPDKNYFLAQEGGYPAMDYEKLIETLREKTGFAKYIDITDTLSIDNYYRTDPHWRQESLCGTAERLAAGMGAPLSGDYAVNTLDRPFYGAYCGQSALPLEPDTLRYLTNETIEACEVYDYETGMTAAVYDMEKAAGKDAYEIFLLGSKSLLSIKNPNAQTGRRLILFRDSFGSSIAPLLLTGYSEIVLVDIRYISSAALGGFIQFENCDALFLFSTLALNNSVTMK